MSVVRPFSVLSKDESGPESKTGRFLSKAEILGVGVFSPLSMIARTPLPTFAGNLGDSVEFRRCRGNSRDFEKIQGNSVEFSGALYDA